MGCTFNSWYGTWWLTNGTVGCPMTDKAIFHPEWYLVYILEVQTYHIIGINTMHTCQQSYMAMEKDPFIDEWPTQKSLFLYGMSDCHFDCRRVNRIRIGTWSPNIGPWGICEICHSNSWETLGECLVNGLIIVGHLEFTPMWLLGYFLPQKCPAIMSVWPHVVHWSKEKTRSPCHCYLRDDRRLLSFS